MASLEFLTRDVEMMKALPMNIGFLLVPSEGTHFMGIAIRHGSLNLLDFMIDNLVEGDFTKQMLNTIAVPRDLKVKARSDEDTSVIGQLHPGDGILMMLLRSQLIPSDVKIRSLRKLSRLGLKISLSFSDPLIKSLDQTSQQDLVRLFLETNNFKTQGDQTDVEISVIFDDLMKNDALSVINFFSEKMMNEILSGGGYPEMKKSQVFWLLMLKMAISVGNIPAISKWFELKNFIEPEAWLSDWAGKVGDELMLIQFPKSGPKSGSKSGSESFIFDVSDELRDELINLWKWANDLIIAERKDLVQFYWKYGNQQLLAEIMASPLSYHLYRYVFLSRWEMICQRQEIVDQREVILSSDFQIDPNDSEFKSLSRRVHLVELEMDLPLSMSKEDILQNGQELLLLLKQFHGNMSLVDKLLKNLAQVGFSDVEFVDLQIFNHPDCDFLIGALLDSFPSVSSVDSVAGSDGADSTGAGSAGAGSAGAGSDGAGSAGAGVGSTGLDLNLVDFRRLSQMDCSLWKNYWLHSSNVGRLKNTEDLISFEDLAEMNQASFVVLSRVAWDLDNLTEYVLKQTNGQNKYDSAFKAHGLDGLPIWSGDEFELLSRHPKAVQLVETFRNLEMISHISEQTINELKNCLDGFDSTTPYFQELFLIKFPKKNVASLSDEKQAVIESEALSQLYLYLNGLSSSEVATLKLLNKHLSRDFIKDVMTGKECLAMFNRVMTSAIKTWEEFNAKKSENPQPKSEMKFQMRFDPIDKVINPADVVDDDVAAEPDTSGDYALALLLSKQEDTPQATQLISDDDDDLLMY